MKSADPEQYSHYWKLEQNSRIVKGDNLEAKQAAKQEYFAQDEQDFYFDAFVHLEKNVRGWKDSRSGRDSDDGVVDSASELDALHLDRVGKRFDNDPPPSVE